MRDLAWYKGAVVSLQDAAEDTNSKEAEREYKRAAEDAQWYVAQIEREVLK